MDHDQLFKNLLVDYPRQALELLAPEEAADIPADAEFLPIRQEQLKERFADSHRELDVPLLVTFPSGEREAIVFLLEEETQARLLSLERLAHYCLDVAQLLGTRRVVPVVVVLRGQPKELRLSLGTERRNYLTLDFVCCALSRLEADDYLQSGNIVARLNLVNMRHPRSGRLRLYENALEALRDLESEEEKRRKYWDFVDLYAALSEDEMLEFEKREAERERGGVPMINRMAERFEKRVLERGVEKGRAEGKAEALAGGLLDVLLARGFLVSVEQRDRVLQSRDETLLRTWLVRAATAASLDEVFE